MTTVTTDDSASLELDSSIHDNGEIAVRMYTPAMMAQMLGISVRAIRMWHRTGLLQSTKVVMKIPHFDYTALATARTYAGWIKQGVSAQSIVHQMSALGRLLGTGPTDLFEGLSICLEGKRLVLSRDSVRIDASGQFQLGFDSCDDGDSDDQPATIKLTSVPNECAESESNSKLLRMLDLAAEAEDEERFDAAAQIYRDLLVAFGPNPEVCFQLAEVLYRQSDLSGARERYYMVIELDPDLVEARANLGCVLIESNHTDQAIAVFKQALDQFPEYADVHFHLAHAMEAQGNPARAAEHWRAFLHLAPASPWADEATLRLSEIRSEAAILSRS